MSRIFEALKRAGAYTPQGLNILLEQTATLEHEACDAASSPRTESEHKVRSFGQQEWLSHRVCVRPVLHSPPVWPFDEPDSYASEQYRIVRTRLLQHARKPHVVLISSPGIGDGKSVTAINLAAVLALEADLRVLLVDADLRRSAIAPQLGMPQCPGLADHLAGKCRLEDAVIQVEHLRNMFVIPSGGSTTNAAELLGPTRWLPFCEEAQSHFDYVIVDSPPIGCVADYELLESASHGVILVVRPDHTNRMQCFDALLKVPKEKLIGVLTNCSGPWSKRGTSAYFASDRSGSLPRTK